MNNCGIYQITNSKNGNRYIGSAVNIASRWLQHRRALRENRHENKHLQKAVNRYGMDVFVFTKILLCDKGNLLLFEQRAIDILQPEYNIFKTAGSALGVKVSDKTKKKISKSLIGHTFSEETIQKMRLAKLGKKQNWSHTPSDATKKKLHDALVGRSLSQETRRKMSASRTGERNPFWGKRHTEEAKQKNRLAHLKNKGDGNYQDDKTVSEAG